MGEEREVVGRLVIPVLEEDGFRTAVRTML